jgi:hypothetical protein
VILEGRAQSMEAVLIGPDDEAVDAFLLTIRLFYQDRDGISIRALAKIYERATVPQHLRDEFRRVRNALNDRLDSNPSIGFEIDGVILSRRDLLEVFLYGGHAHVNPDKRLIYEHWREFPIFPFMTNEFLATLGELFNCVRWIRDINRRLLEASTETHCS